MNRLWSFMAVLFVVDNVIGAALEKPPPGGKVMTIVIVYSWTA
jgi:hypothetical protein